MTVLSEDKQRPSLMPAGGYNSKKFGMAGYTNFAGGSTVHTIYKGSLVMIDVSDTDGYVRAVPLTSSTNAASGDVFCGVAKEKQKVLAADTADGAVKVSLFQNGIWGFPVGSIAITDIGAPAYASDDDTIVTASTNNIWVGLIVDRDATYVWVDIAAAVNRTNTPT